MNTASTDKLLNGILRPSSLSRPQLAALVLGGTIATYGLSRRSLSGMALATAGGVFVYAGLSSVRKNTDEQDFVESSVTINCTPAETYKFWRDFENLPRFMRHVESVSSLENGKTRWVVLGPGGSRIKWDAEIIKETENELIYWRSLPGSDISLEGTVEFRPATGNRGTLVTASFLYSPPGGKLGSSIAKIMGKNPKFMLRQDLRRFKALIETGEIPTTVGQSHGPRSLKVGIARMLDPDQPIRPESRITELLVARRRIA